MRRLGILALILNTSIAVQPDLFSQKSGTWSFAVSGDSRNCGNIVMPAIAEGVHNDGAEFYWHLGDFRAIYDFDQDILNASEYRSRHLTISDYQKIAWQDFIDHQLAPFGDLPVYLTIGNHELIPPKTRADVLQQFADWLNSPKIRDQRLHDDAHDHMLRTYNHWVERGVDFVSMDNSSQDDFDREQLEWFEHLLNRDLNDATIRSIVVGMHDALPDSISAGHSMNESPQMEQSGRSVYSDLLAFRRKSGKYVYVLASHSHFLIEDPYNDACHSAPSDVLPGWIVGTAGAVRYRLPAKTGKAKLARTDVYGYLLATVQSSGEIRFQFKEIGEGNIPPSVLERYETQQLHECFTGNKSDYVPEGPNCQTK